jgi:hypothetical protein
METLGLVIFAALFVLSGVSNHQATAGYTASVVPASLKPLAFLGGWPTGVALIAGGVGAGFGEVWALYGIAGFLAVATALFHRDFLKDPGGFKGVALAGAALALASLLG